jgi:hypothetical protein
MDISKIRGVLTKILTFPRNNATAIYEKLDNQLKECKDLEQFYKINFKLRSQVDALKKLCTSKDRKENLHIIGSAIQERLGGRFVKETTKSVDMSQDQHIAKFLEANKNLNPETDAELVQAGFLCIFEV